MQTVVMGIQVPALPVEPPVGQKVGGEGIRAGVVVGCDGEGAGEGGGEVGGPPPEVVRVPLGPMVALVSAAAVPATVSDPTRPSARAAMRCVGRRIMMHR